MIEWSRERPVGWQRAKEGPQQVRKAGFQKVKVVIRSPDQEVSNWFQVAQVQLARWMSLPMEPEQPERPLPRAVVEVWMYQP